MVADVGNPCAVRRPRGVFFLDVFIGGELFGLLRGYVIDIERVEGVVAEIALNVLLEVVAIDDDGLGRRWGLPFLSVGFGLGMEGEQELFRVGRPAVAFDVLVGDGGELLGLAAAAVEEPDLGAFGGTRTRGRKADVPAVWAEFGRAGAFLAEGELEVDGAIPFDHP